MRPPAWFRWLGFALLGIAVAAAVSIAASRLSSQQIGLASEPISAGDDLIPGSAGTGSQSAPRDTPRHHRRHPQADDSQAAAPVAPAPTTSTPPAPAPPVAPSSSPSPSSAPPADSSGSSAAEHHGERDD